MALKWKKDPAAFGRMLADVRQLAQRVRDPSINAVSKQLGQIQDDPGVACDARCSAE